MSVIYVLIPIAVLLTIAGIYLFFWAVKTEQFNDLEKEGLSILFEDTNKKDQCGSENQESKDSLNTSQTSSNKD